MDQFLVPGSTYVRLRNEWHKYGSLTVACDFDQTLCDFHNQGNSYEMVRQLLRDLHEVGNTIVIWTANPNPEYVAKYLKENNVPFHHINEGGIKLGWESPKPFFSALLDDRAGLASAYYDLKTLVNYIKFIQTNK